MNGNGNFRRVAGWAALAAAVAQVGVFAVIFTSLPSEMFTDPTAVLRAGPGAATAAHWNLILGMLDLYTLGGLAYVVIGAMGAVLLAVINPQLISDYGTASPARREAIEVTIQAFQNGVALGLWNTLETIPAGVWLVGVGGLLMRKSRGLGVLTVTIGALFLVSMVLTVLDVTPMVGVVASLLMTPWAIWIGIQALRNGSTAAVPAAAASAVA